MDRLWLNYQLPNIWLNISITILRVSHLFLYGTIMLGKATIPFHALTTFGNQDTNHLIFLFLVGGGAVLSYVGIPLYLVKV